MRPRRGSKETPKDMRVVRRVGGNRREKRAEQNGGAEMKTREDYVGYLPWVVVNEKLNSVERALKKMTENH